MKSIAPPNPARAPTCAALLLVAVCTPVSAGAQEGPTTVLRCGRLLDVVSGELLRDQVIVVSGNRIRAVGPAASVVAPADARIIDLRQATVLPGLIDVHTHLTDDGAAYDLADPLKRSGAQMALESLRNARATLAAGFTTVRDVGTFRAFVGEKIPRLSSFTQFPPTPNPGH